MISCVLFLDVHMLNGSRMDLQRFGMDFHGFAWILHGFGMDLAAIRSIIAAAAGTGRTPGRIN